MMTAAQLVAQLVEATAALKDMTMADRTVFCLVALMVGDKVVWSVESLVEYWADRTVDWMADSKASWWAAEMAGRKVHSKAGHWAVELAAE